MEHFICTTCGTQFSESGREPDGCPICRDERQYVGPGGQQWTTHARLRRSHRNAVRTEDAGLVGIGMAPDFAIGQRALLVRGAAGNVLWDCVPLLDDGLTEMIRGIGGIRAIAISHPHYYATMVDWARAFDCPIHLHAADRAHVMRPDPSIRFWDGDTLDLGDGMTLLRLGGHFAGGTVLHWAAGAEGCGALLSGDIVQVIPDRRWVSFMYSYPNLIPLPASEVRRMADALRPYEFERVLGAWWSTVVPADGKGVVLRSAERYAAAVGG
ncbi:MBL fold metallo-hydrolase [Longimicrobium sp.]|uniref:MBL fold metallo-hydrolase n=1 Tax=Longimicrobium sp. TaxID=2029185 RepID=UPI002E309C65|nr:MBL fold metallo-hydrolase [Longimicrobium sp.]HEX6037656.1 MBL fold metallo-hydrolase [Longimicrobium sp.]